MSLTDLFKNMSNRKKIIIAAAAVLVIAAAVICIVFARNGYMATTMRLLRVEGTVNIEDSKGGTKPVLDNLRFQSGDALNTGDDGLASVGLDNAKIVTLQNDSRAEFKKKNKQLELKLTKGAVFFNVTEKLRADEKFEIKTSTMTAGIRGTSGMIYYDDADGREALLITDGSVEVSATNPETGETKTAMVESGQEIKVYLYFDRVKDSVAFELNKVTEKTLPNFAAKRIAENDALAKRVCAANNWDKDNVQKKSAEPESTTTAAPTTEATTAATTENTTEATTTTTSETSETTTESTTVTESTTAKPTSTPTPKPKATATPKPTKKPTPKVTQTSAESTPETVPETTPETTPETAPETEATTSSETTTTKATTTTTTTKPTSSAPSLPDGYSKVSEGWGTTYNGATVYVCQLTNHGISGSEYLGYENGKWIDLSYYEQKSGRYMDHRFVRKSDNSLYFDYDTKLY